MRPLSIANRLRAEIGRLRVAIRAESAAGGLGGERLHQLKARKSRLSDELVALEIESFAAKWR